MKVYGPQEKVPSNCWKMGNLPVYHVGVSKNGWFIMENPMKIHDLEVPPIFGNNHVYIYCTCFMASSMFLCFCRIIHRSITIVYNVLHNMSYDLHWFNIPQMYTNFTPIQQIHRLNLHFSSLVLTSLRRCCKSSLPWLRSSWWWRWWLSWLTVCFCLLHLERTHIRNSIMDRFHEMSESRSLWRHVNKGKAFKKKLLSST